MFRKQPYKSQEAEAYTTAINILAVEYLIRTYNWGEYTRRAKQVYELTPDELVCLYIELSMNKHTSNLGAMISHGDFGGQRDDLLYFLDHPEERIAPPTSPIME